VLSPPARIEVIIVTEVRGEALLVGLRVEGTRASPPAPIEVIIATEARGK
jgi:hypothetical protein